MRSNSLNLEAEKKPATPNVREKFVGGWGKLSSGVSASLLSPSLHQFVPVSNGITRNGNVANILGLGRVRKMNEPSSLEVKHRFLKNALIKSLHKREQVELNIREKLEELKKLEVLLEKSRLTWNKWEFAQDYL